MIEKEFNGIHWLEFELLEDLPLIHGCLKRHGGVSPGLLESLNLGRSVGDDPQNVHSNFNKVKEALSLPEILPGKLSHGVKVTTVLSKNQELPISDALTTAIPGLAISISQADCQAAIFYDPVQHVLANVHCGWRGNVQNIYEATVKAMQSAHGSDPSNLLVCISPSLGPNHAEFIHFRTELPESFWKYQSQNLCFNFWDISRHQLEKAGILPHHVQIAEIDTYSHPDYFSHRYSTHQGLVPCGRQATICALQEK